MAEITLLETFKVFYVKGLLCPFSYGIALQEPPSILLGLSDESFILFDSCTKNNHFL